MENKQEVSATRSSASMFQDLGSRLNPLNYEKIANVGQYFGSGLQKWRDGSFLLDINLVGRLFGGSGGIVKGITPRRKLHGQKSLKCLWMTDELIPTEEHYGRDNEGRTNADHHSGSVICFQEPESGTSETSEYCGKPAEDRLEHGHSVEREDNQTLLLSETFKPLVQTKLASDSKNQCLDNTFQSYGEECSFHSNSCDFEDKAHKGKFDTVSPISEANFVHYRPVSDKDGLNDEHSGTSTGSLETVSNKYCTLECDEALLESTCYDINTNNIENRSHQTDRDSAVFNSRESIIDNEKQINIVNSSNEIISKNSEFDYASYFTVHNKYQVSTCLAQSTLPEHEPVLNAEDTEYSYPVDIEVSPYKVGKVHTGEEVEIVDSTNKDRAIDLTADVANQISANNDKYLTEEEGENLHPDINCEDFKEEVENLYFANKGEADLTDEVAGNLYPADNDEDLTEEEVEHLCPVYLSVQDGFVSCRILTPSLEEEIRVSGLYDDTEFQFLSIDEGRVCFRSHCLMDRSFEDAFEDEETFSIVQLFNGPNGDACDKENLPSHSDIQEFDIKYLFNDGTNGMGFEQKSIDIVDADNTFGIVELFREQNQELHEAFASDLDIEELNIHNLFNDNADYLDNGNHVDVIDKEDTFDLVGLFSEPSEGVNDDTNKQEIEELNKYSRTSLTQPLNEEAQKSL